MRIIDRIVVATFGYRRRYEFQKSSYDHCDVVWQMRVGYGGCLPKVFAGNYVRSTRSKKHKLDTLWV
jgi:hypothetical protein